MARRTEAPAWSESERDRKGRVERGETVLANQRRGRDRALIEWAKAAGLYVCIDRRTDWGNPSEMPGDGTRDEVCDKFADHFRRTPELRARVGELRGKVLGCWCYPERCHGNIIIEALGLPVPGGDLITGPECEPECEGPVPT